MDQYGHNIGEGVYMSPKPEIMESSCPEITYDKKKYKIGIICRLRPDKIRYPNGFENYWIINGTDNEIRPWGFIIKEFSQFNLWHKLISYILVYLISLDTNLFIYFNYIGLVE